MASAAAASTSACPLFGEGTRLATVLAPELSEISGMAASHSNPGVLWLHNDSGDTARLFALSTKGELLGTFTLPTVRAIDWEDMAIGPKRGSRGSYLYVGDIGDNSARRKDGILVHRVPEPVVSARPRGEAALANLETFRLRYPDGPHDAETLLVDPKTGELVILTKVMFGAPRVFRAGPTLVSETLLTEEEPLDFEAIGIDDGLYATGGAVSPDGRFVVVRGYGNAYLWQRDPERPLHEAFRSRACRVPLASEPQGEAIAFAADGSGYFTLSEKRAQPLFFFARQ